MFLVRERFDGRRVEGPLAFGDGQCDREFGDRGLARPGWGADKHRGAGGEVLHRLSLETVEPIAAASLKVIDGDAQRFRSV